MQLTPEAGRRTLCVGGGGTGTRAAPEPKGNLGRGCGLATSSPLWATLSDVRQKETDTAMEATPAA